MSGASLTLRPVLHAKGDRNRYCGPSAISAVTGMNTGEAARLLRAVSGRAAIRGAHNEHMALALGRCGVRIAKSYVPAKDKRPTLAAWLTATHGTRGGKVFLVVAGNHYQLISGNRYVCGKVGSVVPLDHPTIKRRARVAQVFTLEAWRALTIPKEARKPAPSPAVKAQAKARSSARKSALALAAKWGVEIEPTPDLPPYLCVDGPAAVYGEDGAWPDEADDPLAGSRLALDWSDVLDKVETYAADLKAKGIKPAA